MMDAQQAFEALAARARAMTIGHVWRGHGSAIGLELGTLTPKTRDDGSPGIPQGQLTLMVEWSWRLEDRTHILCGSWSDDTLWETTLDRLLGLRISGLTLFGALPEIALETTEGLRFLSFSTTDGDPQWVLFDNEADPLWWVDVADGRLQIGT